MPASIKEVAAQAGVSVATVSSLVEVRVLIAGRGPRGHDIRSHLACAIAGKTISQCRPYSTASAGLIFSPAHSGHTRDIPFKNGKRFPALGTQDPPTFHRPNQTLA